MFRKFLEKEGDLCVGSNYGLRDISKIHSIVQRLRLDPHIRSLAVEIFNQFTSRRKLYHYAIYPYVCVGIATKFITSSCIKGILIRMNQELSRLYTVLEKDVIETLLLSVPLTTTHNFLSIVNSKLCEVFDIDVELKKIEKTHNLFLPSITVVAVIYSILPKDRKSRYVEKIHKLTGYTLTDIDYVYRMIYSNYDKFNENTLPRLLRKIDVNSESISSGSPVEVDEYICEGSFAKVYEVTYRGKPCILKKFIGDRTLQISDIRDITYLKFLQSSSIVELIDTMKFDSGNFSYGIMMEDLDDDLYTVVHKMEDLSNGEKLDIVKKFLKCVDYIHSIGVVHSDIKLSNVMLSDGKVKLIDFGLSFLHTYSIINNSISIGTAINNSIEFLMDDYSFSFPFDYWSCGCVIFEIMKEDHPFDRQDYRVRTKDALVGRILRVVSSGEYDSLSREKLRELYKNDTLNNRDFSDLFLDTPKIATVVGGFFNFDRNERLSVSSALSILE